MSEALEKALVVVVDPSQLWVNANIDETSVARLRVGQAAPVHVDALGSDMPGMVEATKAFRCSCPRAWASTMA